MRICVVTPAAAAYRPGNRVTAERWAAILGELGHEAVVREEYRGEPCQVLVVLHARKGHGSVVRYRRRSPDGPLIVALTGTDLYGELRDRPETLESMEAADRLVVLQEKAPEAIPAPLREKARVIYQSVPELWGRNVPLDTGTGETFQVCLLAHLRPVKDPFRAAEAARLLPEASALRIVHCGAALSEAMEARAREEMATNPRYLWLGEVSRDKALRLLCQSQALALTSRAEGAGNAISEALSAGVPVLCSQIPGLVGMVGEDYPGYFPPGDTAALARLFLRAETEEGFYRWLRAACARRAPLVDPARERAAWAALLAELAEAAGR